MLRCRMSQWISVSPAIAGFDEVIRPAVWAMVQSTYAPIGLILDYPAELDEYDVWTACEHEGQLIAFQLEKTTAFGLKGGLLGSDGSRLGRAALKAYLTTWFHQPGHYGEVSHRVLELAQAARAPVVCGVHVSRILGKPVVVEADGVHYRRRIKNVGEVRKVMVGLPDGVPVTPIASPQCAVGGGAELQGRVMPHLDSSHEALLDHVASLVVL